MQEFDRRLTLSQEEHLLFKLVENPFSMDPKEVFIQLQLEVIELQASFVCKIKRRESSLLDFYRNLNSDKYKNPAQLAKKKLSIFGNTYICKPVAQPGFLHGGRGPTFLNNSAQMQW